MSGSYKDSPERVRQFLNNVSSETKALNVKILGYADRAGRITKRANPVEFDAIVNESAVDVELFAQRVEGALPDYQHNLKLTTEGFEKRVNSLDPKKRCRSAGIARHESRSAGSCSNRHLGQIQT